MIRLLLRIILLAYPRSHRQRFGAQWLATADALLGRARGARRIGVAARLVRDALTAVPGAHRQERGSEGWIRRWVWDLRQAARSLWWRRRTAGVCMLVLAIGMGVNAAVFSVANAALLRPLDYADPEALVLAWGDWRAAGFPEAPLSPPQFAALADSDALFESVGAVWASNATLTGGELPEQVSVGHATASFFATLGVAPARGRLLRDEDAVDSMADDASGGVLLSHAFWQRSLGADPDAIGRSLRIDGVGYEIVGVLPERFRLFFPPGKGVPAHLDLYLALPPPEFLNPANFYLRAVGRLRTGIGLSTAAEALQPTAARLREERTDLADSDVVFRLQGLQRQWSTDLRVGLLTVQAGALLLLLLAVTNVTSILVALAVDRLPTLAVRACLGAGRGRLVRQLLFEGALLSFASVLLGALLGGVALTLLWRLRPESLQRLVEVGPDQRVALYSLAIAAATVLFVSAGPVLLVVRQRLSGLIAARASGGTGRLGLRLRRGAAVVQIASAFALMVAASLLARSVANLQQADSGFDVADRIAFAVGLPLQTLPDDVERARVVGEIAARVAALPGVRSVGAGSHLPLDGWVNWAGSVLPVETPDDPAHQAIVDHRAVTPGYFDVLGATLAEGRGFRESDDLVSGLVAVVDAPLARRLGGKASVLGRQVEVGVWRDFRFHRLPATIVGVVEPLRDRAPHEPSSGQVYVPFAQSPRWEIGFVAATERPLALADGIRRAVAAVHPELAASRFRLLADDYRRKLGPTRFASLLALVVAASAAFLSATGIYGVLALETRGRAHEIGVRLALGARVEQVFRMVIATGARLGLAGIALGVPLALAFASLLRSSLFGVGGFEAVAYVPAALAALVLGGLAAALPARRATRTDPLATLRAGLE